MSDVRIIPVPCAREFAEGDDLGAFLSEAVAAAGGLQAGDVVVVTQKAVSKCEGRLRRLDDVRPSELALRHATTAGADARVIELALQEACRVVRMSGGVLITQTHHGFVCANSGVDQSNVPPGYALLLPADPDRSAAELRAAFHQHTGIAPVVIVSDSFGRAWRIGQTDVAIGIAGAAPLIDYRGHTDRFGRELRATMLAVADELAGAAELVTRKTDGAPAAIVRGYALPDGPGGIASLLRPPSEDLFL